MHRLRRVHRKRHACGENAAHYRQQQPFFQVEFFGFDAHFTLFELTRAGDDPDANQRNQHPEQRHTPAFGVNQHIKISIDDRGHQRTDNQRNADGNANPHRHAEVAHGQTVVDIADAPHGAEQKHRQ